MRAAAARRERLNAIRRNPAPIVASLSLLVSMQLFRRSAAPRPPGYKATSEDAVRTHQELKRGCRKEVAGLLSCGAASATGEPRVVGEFPWLTPVNAAAFHDSLDGCGRNPADYPLYWIGSGMSTFHFRPWT